MKKKKNRRLNVSSISTGDAGDSNVLQLDVPESITLADLKALISSEMPAVPSTSQHLYYNGRLLADPTLTLEQCHVKDDDMLVVHTTGNSQAGPSRPQGQQGQHGQLGQQPSQSQQQPQSQQAQRQSTGSRIEYDPEMIRLQVLGNPSLQSQLRESNPELWEAVNDPPKFATIFQEMERQKAEADRAKQREIVCLLLRLFVFYFFFVRSQPDTHNSRCSTRTRSILNRSRRSRSSSGKSR